jgi:hypothetical protein
LCLLPLSATCHGQASVHGQAQEKPAVDTVTVAGPTALDRGFTDLYNLGFDDGQREFSSCSASIPMTRLGP